MKPTLRQHVKGVEMLMPKFPTFWVDPFLISTPEAVFDYSKLCYAFFDGRANVSPCALLGISIDPDRLPNENERWLRDCPKSPGQHESILVRSFERAARYIGPGGSRKRLADTLKKLGVVRDVENGYAKRPFRRLGGQKEVVVESIARCLAHIADPRPEPAVDGRTYPFKSLTKAGAEKWFVMRPIRGYDPSHGLALQPFA